MLEFREEKTEETMTGRLGKRPETQKKNWPQDLLLSILVSLPSKSLLRFKCVSKDWGSLICSPDFIEHHLENQKNREYPKLMFASSEPETDIVLESVAIVDVKVREEGRLKTRKGFERSPPFNICHLPLDVYYASNSCDGVLCFYGENNVFVFNPGTREFRFLQIRKEGLAFPAYSYFDCFGRRFSSSHLIGFGRDQVTKKCKIVRLFRPNGVYYNHIHQCEVFTLRSNAGSSWRRIGEVAYFIRPSQQPVFVNGALHWLLDTRHANPSEVVISFDLHTEIFRAISHPSCCSSEEASLNQGGRPRFMGLLCLRNSLCLAEPELGLQLNIWIMNQSNANWERLTCIDWEFIQHGIPLPLPLVELKDGTYFVCHRGDNLQIYYPGSQSLGDVLLKHEREVVPFIYCESLVPLYGEPLVY